MLGSKYGEAHHIPRSPKRGSLEVELPEIAAERLEPLIDLLTDLLVGERIREIQKKERYALMKTEFETADLTTATWQISEAMELPDPASFDEV